MFMVICINNDFLEDNDQRTLLEAGITNNIDIFVWDGVQVTVIITSFCCLFVCCLFINRLEVYHY